MDQDEQEEAARWADNLRARAYAASQANRERQKYVQITNIPNKMNARSLVSFIAQTCRTVPILVDMCMMRHPGGRVQPAALVQFKSEQDALRTVELIKASNYGSSWKMKLIVEPKFVAPTEEDVKVCLSLDSQYQK